jgi:S1-C subfamily serine protease
VDAVNRVVPQIIAKGRYAPPSLGIETDETLSRAIAQQLGVVGVAVLRVPASSVNAKAGLRGIRIGPRNTVIPGDVILAVDGKEVDSVARLTTRLDDYRIGAQVQLTVWREGKQLQLQVALQNEDEDR